MKVDVIEGLPRKFLSCGAKELVNILPRPTIIHLKGKSEPALMVTVLLHGDETTGLFALQSLLSDYSNSGHELERSLSIFIGNVRAAQAGVRMLEDQPDFNRIWNGSGHPENEMADFVLSHMKKRGLFASIDLHNNSGHNPHYGCVNLLDHRYINLACMFSNIVVYFTEPHEVHSMAFAPICPSVTLECGQAGETDGIEHVKEYLKKCLRLANLPENDKMCQEAQVYHTIARICLPQEARVSFDLSQKEADFCFVEDLDRLNFQQVEERRLIGWRLNPNQSLSVIDNQGKDVYDKFITLEQNRIRFKKPVFPSMFTKKVKAIKQDCLGYLMELYPLP